MTRHLIAAYAAAVLVASTAHAEPDACTVAADLEGQCRDLADTVAGLVEAAKPVCVEKALARECARRRLEIKGFMQSLRDLNAERQRAAAQCAAERKKD